VRRKRAWGREQREVAVGKRRSWEGGKQKRCRLTAEGSKLKAKEDRGREHGARDRERRAEDR
jgi:hypothetical protein